ncbi:AMP-binding protein [Buttiauxella selenatireducens]|uniref:AMP-binding protein n=1 Tax=Buttiauxella selenatireducens TaxID=3073902 RepID=A0ABY9S7G0_9ENTR|nr:AMP-binding protein [Buttiauxella sp. R73]WMY72885.1 AMP-binding protein [Buttiauxella sp. R73]
MNSPLALAKWLSGDRHPQHVVAFAGEQCFTQTDLMKDVQRIYRWLHCQPGKRWALCFDNSYDFIAALLATLHAGKTPVLPGHSREAQLREQQRHFCGVISDVPLNLDCPVLNPQTLDYPALTSFEPVPDDAGVVFFTSGSTGEPTQIFKTLCALDEEIVWLAALWGEDLHDCRLVGSVSHQHLYGFTFRVMLPMALGLACDALMIHFPEQLAARAAHPLLFISSPAFLKRLDINLAAPVFKRVISAAGKLDDDTAQQALAWLKTPVSEIYGTTETGVLAWREHDKPDPEWQAFPAVQFTPQGDGWRVASPLIHQGHVQLDDILEFTAQRRFRLIGRRDRIVKIEEKRISLSEIERRLMALPGIEDAAVVPVTRGKRIALGAVVVAPKADATSKQQWREALSAWLEPLAIPRFWRVVERIPLNSQSKRAWAQLQELFDETR